MAQLSASAYAAKYIDPTTGLFKPNGTKSITASRLNQFVQDTTDSLLNLVTDFGKYIRQGDATGTNSYAATVDSAGGNVYTSRALYIFTFANTSTGPCTIALNGGPAVKIFVDTTTQADEDDISSSSGYICVYKETLDGGGGGILILSAAGGGQAGYAQEVVDTTGDTITLDLKGKSFGNFSGDTPFLAPREVVLMNADNAAFYDFNLRYRMWMCL